jgi:Ca2+-transporting ATPase
MESSVQKKARCSQSAEQVLNEFSVSVSGGLSPEEAEKRLEYYGPNKLEEKKRKSIFVRFFEQLNDVLIYILVAASGISFFLGEISDGIIILGVVFINGIVGVVQESKAEQALEALRKMASPKALVRRGGETMEIDSEAIVPGEVVLLEAGRIVPCDIRLIESADLKIEESALTGESVPVEKNADAPHDAFEGTPPLGDQINMAFMSTVVTYGRGTGVAVGTGMATEMGEIADLLEGEKKSLTPLQEKLDKFGKTIGFLILILCGVMFGISLLEEYLRHEIIVREVLFELFLTAVSLAVAAIPEGLPAIVTIVLAIGVQRMSRRNAIVRKLPAVETLGSVTVICSDKTGTLTQNRMTVTQFYTAGNPGSRIENGGRSAAVVGIDTGNPVHRRLLEIMVLCNDATYSGDSQTGDPTEVALVAAGADQSLDKKVLEEEHPRLTERPFDSDRKLMSTVHAYGAEKLVLTKGALDNLLQICTRLRCGTETVALDDETRNEILEEAEQLSSRALRVLGAAYRPLAEENFPAVELEKDLIFTGFVGMIDPPRLEVKDSIEECRQAGVQTVMITGDHRITALAIARELNIAHEEVQTLEGADLDAMRDEELCEKVKTVRIFARVSPAHKVRIVQALKHNGNIVSMTGDGVNDAPSLNAADIGVSMGITGTDVAKGASDMVLTDDNFSTIAAAVEEGRNIYKNIKKTITFLLSCNAGEIVAIFTSILFGWTPPLLPIHILWVNLITDTFPALALGMDPGDPEIMKYPPRDPEESLFAHGGGKNVIFNGILIGSLTLLAYFLARRFYPGSLRHAQTIAFAVLSFSQLFHAFNLRHERLSIFQVGLLTNKYIIGALFVGMFLQVAVITVPGVSDIFKVTPLGLWDWCMVIGFALMPVFVNEAVKAVRRIL